MSSYGQRHRTPTGNPVFHLSFDTASQSTHDSYSQARYHGSGPSTTSNTTTNGGSRRTVRYVNPQRQFDPRYDPRQPETYTVYYQPHRDDDRRHEESGDEDDDDTHDYYFSSDAGDREHATNGNGRQLQYRAAQSQALHSSSSRDTQNVDNRQYPQGSPSKNVSATQAHARPSQKGSHEQEPEEEIHFHSNNNCHGRVSPNTTPTVNSNNRSPTSIHSNRQKSSSQRVNRFFSQPNQAQSSPSAFGHLYQKNKADNESTDKEEYSTPKTGFSRLFQQPQCQQQQQQQFQQYYQGDISSGMSGSAHSQPFDELSRSAGGVDSLDEFLKQPQDSLSESSTTDNGYNIGSNNNNNRGGGDAALSAIEENPSMETSTMGGGSLTTYSYSQMNPSMIHPPYSNDTTTHQQQQQQQQQQKQQRESLQNLQHPTPGSRANGAQPSPEERLSIDISPESDDAEDDTEEEIRFKEEPWTKYVHHKKESMATTAARMKNTSQHQEIFVVTPTRKEDWLTTTPPSSGKFSQKSARSPVRRIRSSVSSSPTANHSGAPSSRSSVMSTPSNTPSTSSSNMTPSKLARSEAEKLIKSLNSRRKVKEVSSLSPKTPASAPAPGRTTTTTANNTPIRHRHESTPTTQTSTSPMKTSNSDPSTTEDSHSVNTEEQDLTLHDLCGESSSTDDIAWRNAIHVLSIQPHLASLLDGAGWTPLHVACLGSTPPPVFMTRSLLYVYREAARKEDEGGRLPLHLVAASSGDVETMQLLIQAYPQAVYQTDTQGWTPLHLLLKNFSANITLEHCQVLLGLSEIQETKGQEPRILQRKGDHLNLGFEELNKLIHRPAPVSRLAQEDMHEAAFQAFPSDVQTSLRRLCQWKRRLRRTQRQGGDYTDEAVELNMASSFETNPAAHITPTKRQLPLHIIVRRGLSEHRDQSTSSEFASPGTDTEEPTSNCIAPRFLELVRLFIAYYPEGLVVCDIHGYTPLLTALLMGNMQPSMELVELLLGRRTSGYNSLPKWASDMPLYNFNAERYLNPAMVPLKTNQQLPLHVVAEEMAHNYSMLAAVHESYPGAIQVQDSRGRTPLHILLRNYLCVPVTPKTMALLLSDKVAQTFDDDGKIPFDLLAESASKLPREDPELNMSNRETSSADTDAFKKFFQESNIAFSKPEARNRSESDSFLWRLRSLPPWLRRQACSVSFVQELLVEELASPMKSGLVFLYGTLLFMLIVAFRVQMEQFIQTPELNMSSWSSLILLITVSGVFLFQIAFWFLCMSMSGFLQLCLFNVWRWIDLLAILLVGFTTLAIHYSWASADFILVAGTAATGTLWLSAIGFLSCWWYGAAIFSAAVQKIATLMMWPAVAALIVLLTFAQMFYTLAQIDCVDALGDLGVCTVPESYRLVYYLLVGEPIVDLGSDTQIANAMLVLVALFAAVMLLLGLGVLSMVFVVGSKWDLDNIVLTSYWEPKLTFVLFTCRPASDSSKSQPVSRFESAWTIVTSILACREDVKGTYWYACFTHKSVAVKALYWMVSAIIVPLWLVAGLVTFGTLWPPQIRRYLFRPALGNTMASGHGKHSPAEVHAVQVSNLRKELGQIRDMSYERSNDVQREVRELREILHLATAE